MPTPAVPKRRVLIPQHGVIQGGVLDGWSFAYIRFVVRKSGTYLELRCTRPNWPFPQTVQFARNEYARLQAGLRAARHDMHLEIQLAKDVAAIGKK